MFQTCLYCFRHVVKVLSNNMRQQNIQGDEIMKNKEPQFIQTHKKVSETSLSSHRI